MIFTSPAQGAVFAPLALKFVKRTLHLFIFDQGPCTRVPVLTINGGMTPHRNRNSGAIAGGVVVGVAAIFSVIGIVTFVQRRRRRSIPRSILSTDSVPADAARQIIVSPFDPDSLGPNQDSGISTEQPEQPLGIGGPEAEMEIGRASCRERV